MVGGVAEPVLPVVDGIEPYAEGRGWAVYCADVMELLPRLPEESIDVVLTDPPYGQTNESYDRGVAPAVWRHTLRACRPDAALLSLAGNPTYHRLATAIEDAGWRIRQMWGWVYRDGYIISSRPSEGFDRLAAAMDPIVFATRGKVLLPLRRVSGQAWSRQRGKRSGYSARAGQQGAAQGSGHWPRSLVASDGVEGFQYFALSRTTPGVSRSTGHPNEKPEALMDWLADKVPGAVVADWFMGSGTTGVAALRAGRRFVGADIDPHWCEVAADRLRAAEQALTP